MTAFSLGTLALARYRRGTFFDPRAEVVVPVGHVWNSAIRRFSGQWVPTVLAAVRQIGIFLFLFEAHCAAFCRTLNTGSLEVKEGLLGIKGK